MEKMIELLYLRHFDIIKHREEEIKRLQIPEEEKIKIIDGSHLNIK
jgi:hypothetical protein